VQLVKIGVIEMKVNKRMLQLVLVFGCLVVLFGCQVKSGAYFPGIQGQGEFQEMANHVPRNRIGSLVSSKRVASYRKSSKFGTHSYGLGLSERNGIIYTCRGGHIDLAHLRNAADWTAYIASTSYNNIYEGNSKFSFKVYEGDICFVEMEYPAVWGYLSEEGKSVVARRIAFGMGEYFSYQFSVWHEIVTWYGYKSTGFYPEFSSAFTWEDMYSNLLGSRLGYLALNDNKHTFSEAVTLAIDGEMENLCLQSKGVAKKAARQMRSGNCKDYVSIANYKKRNFDIGLDDGFITPWIIPSAGDCEDAVAQSYRVPTLDFLDKYDFTVRYKIEPRVWEKDQIFSAVYGEDTRGNKLLDPSLQFGKIMNHIEQMAMQKYGRLSFSDSYDGQVQLVSKTK
jgi:hypothetical protein